MSDRTLAKRYASALLKLAVEKDLVAVLEEDILAVRDIYEANPEFRFVMEHPFLAAAKKKESFRAIFQGKVHDTLLDFVDLIVDKGRVNELPAIAEVFDVLADAHKGVVRAQITSFRPLTDGQRAGLVEKVKGLYPGSDIELREETDESLLGGMVLRIGDQVIDGTVAGRLKKFREHLLDLR